MADRRQSRVFYAPVVSADSNRTLQIAIDGRWSDDRDGTLSAIRASQAGALRGRTSPIPVAFAASNGLTTDAELMALHDNVSFTAKVLPTRAWGTSQGVVTFVAYYAKLSWRPGGQARPYNEETGSLGRVRVTKNQFAWEIGARFSRTDLDDGALQGGALDIASLSAGVYGPYTTQDPARLRIQRSRQNWRHRTNPARHTAFSVGTPLTPAGADRALSAR